MRSLSSISALSLFSISPISEAFSPSFASTKSSLRFPSPFLGNVQSNNANQYNKSPSSSLKLAAEECLLTPEGFGFSTPAERVLKQSSKEEISGYVKSLNTDSVINVMDLISDEENPDVALVFDKSDKLVGIFTERDYVEVSMRH